MKILIIFLSAKISLMTFLQRAKENIQDYQKFQKRKTCLVTNGLNSNNFIKCFGKHFSKILQENEKEQLELRNTYFNHILEN